MIADAVEQTSDAIRTAHTIWIERSEVSAVTVAEENGLGKESEETHGRQYVREVLCCIFPKLDFKGKIWTPCEGG